MNVFGVGPMELMLVFVLALIFIGPAKLPEVAGQLGRAINEFRRASSELSEAFSAQLAEEVAARKAAEQGVTEGTTSDGSTTDGSTNGSADTEWAQQFATLEPNGHAPEAEFGVTSPMAQAEPAPLQGTVLDSEAAYPPAPRVTDAHTEIADVTPAEQIQTSSEDVGVEVHAAPSDTPGIDSTVVMASPDDATASTAASDAGEQAAPLVADPAPKPARSRRRSAATATTATNQGEAQVDATSSTEADLPATVAAVADVDASVDAPIPTDAPRARPRRERKPKTAAVAPTEEPMMGQTSTETPESEV